MIDVKFVIAFLGFMVVWYIGCYLTDTYISKDTDVSWIMAIGAIVYLLADLVSDLIKRS